MGRSKKKLKSLFHRLFSIFRNESCENSANFPIPAMLGDGQCVDLFKLFWVVRERGGKVAVSKNLLWGVVAENLGLDNSVSASVKLVYCKYLDVFDQWLMRVLRDRSLGNLQCEFSGQLGSLLLELENEFKGLFDCNIERSECRRNGKHIGSSIDEIELNSSTKHTGLHIDDEIELSSRNQGDFDRVCEGLHCNGDDHNGVVISDASFRKNECKVRSSKRKKETLLEMLNWVTHVAKNPNDPAIWRFSEYSKWDNKEGKKFRSRALLARKALLVRTDDSLDFEQSISQKKKKKEKKLKTLSSTFNTIIPNQRSRERSRHSKKLPLLNIQIRPCCAPSSAPVNSELETPSNDDSPIRIKHVSVGPLSQAQVPIWTGPDYESDSKWLGTRVWPLGPGAHDTHLETEPIGEGRPDSCPCPFPNTVQCIRFHIAEKRIKLKYELGLVFYRWNFHLMGEEVSLSWTLDEEKLFKDMVRFNPLSLGRCFWDDAFKCFPTRTRLDVVSYYYNVYMIRRRSYQNRVNPNGIDSDDDEPPFGSFCESFGYEAVKIPELESIFCTLNEQCTDW